MDSSVICSEYSRSSGTNEIDEDQQFENVNELMGNVKSVSVSNETTLKSHN